ncbi:bifunctional diaminohydroxyphosphoribosylaminopyrimidine deaminase/5-amino-6-(5-phosphoribosylamino)uracil reductase RibD [Chitinophaga sp.]|uniref:bifunctional diaminohydroxyphosphoribosylaminopyrimidine deaminase/5-amino-6-(5-phosphoribosylamino)uracil reductase RibD n=1 Tax=Chitinophaga sp. TaxID=1869181 RepID=UPI00263206A8|nr:bifunctional diaminohydroxyphosphoribosylaminopyrimidine deaminase/5-amino-6-(5-phosphoribosylamino)uracil reductase RibD [uncultured Chitinophaga sp.]
MQRCIGLALKGSGHVSPNPMVGAVLVQEGGIIGEGDHHFWGGPHAEVNCVNSVPPELQELIPRSTLYVSLEPCAHHGKTPPCADLVIAQNIPEVVIGCVDLFSKVAGKGIEKLRQAGIGVTVGVLEDACRYLNRRFFTFHEQLRPYVVLKWAQSADGFIAPPDRSPVRISNPFADRLVHRWRTEEAGIMVGTQTALLDNPRLTARLWPGKSPVRIVLDLDSKVPGSHYVKDGSVRTLILTSAEIDAEQALVPQVLAQLHKESVLSVIVEGGALLLQQFISGGHWDEARVITGQMALSGGLPAPVLKNALLKESAYIAGDRIDTFVPAFT